MALGDSNVSISAIQAEMGVSGTDVTLDNISRRATLNKFSRYAPGTLGVDGSKNITLTPISTNIKLGEFRRYNHTAAAPEIQISGTQNHDPGTTTLTVVLPIAMGELNLMQIADNGISVDPYVYHLRADNYASSAHRTAGTPMIQSIFPININMDVHTPLVGHSRQSSHVMYTQASSNLAFLTNLDCGSNDVTRYLDVYFCDNAGIRKVNFGTAKSDGYIDIAFHELILPKLIVGTTGGSKPNSDWTVTYPYLNTSYGTPGKCTNLAQINLTYSSNSYSFYLGLNGTRNTAPFGDQMLSATGNVRMTRTGGGLTPSSESKIIAYGVIFDSSAKTQVGGTLSGWARGDSWQYEEVVTISVESIVWGGYSAC